MKNICVKKSASGLLAAVLFIGMWNLSIIKHRRELTFGHPHVPHTDYSPSDGTVVAPSMYANSTAGIRTGAPIFGLAFPFNNGTSDDRR